MRTIVLMVMVLMILKGAAWGAEGSGVTAPGAKLEKLSGEFDFTEGPAADAQGNVYFTDQPNDRIMIWTVAGKLETFMQPCGRSNGLCFDKGGKLWACADEKNEMWVIDPADKKVTVVIKDYQGKLLNAPNDVWCTPSGGVYYSDPMYARKYWEGLRTKEMQQPGKYVYYLAPDHKTLRPVATDLNTPNGLIGTADGKTLYVADIGAKKTYAYDVQENGDLAGKRLFCEMGSDGMTIDEEGNVYLTGKGVTVFDKAGKQIEQIDVPEEKWTANVSFGGKEMKTLFITASKGLYAIQTRVKGAGSQ